MILGANGPDGRVFRPGAFRPSGGQARKHGDNSCSSRAGVAGPQGRLAAAGGDRVGLAAGGLARLTGAGAVADAAWLATAAIGLGYALWSTADSILRGRLGVDVIALLALGGAVAVGELLAAAVISVMLTSGRFLEAWAAERARHDLSTLLARAPGTARRYRGGSLETVPLEEIAIGDALLVAPGDVLPVDGMVASGVAVLDESALTGEALPAEHGPGQTVRSGTMNAGRAVRPARRDERG